MERLRRGWTLKQVSDLTRISITVLKLLEEQRFKRIGEQRTVEMLLRTYANAFGDEGLFSSSFPGGRPGRGALQRDSTKLRSGQYLLPILAASLIVAVIAGLGLFHYKYGTWLVSSEKPIPEARIENRTDRPETVENIVAPGAAEKNTLAGGERLAVGPTGDENREDEQKVEKANTALSGEEANISSPSEQSPAVGRVQTEQQEASANEDAGRDRRPASTSASDHAATVSKEQPGSEAAPNAPTANARSGGAPHRLEMEAAQKTWIQVTIDGIKPRSELLQPGERRSWNAFERAELVIGNRGGVQLKWDGRPVELGGGTARVIKLSLTDSGIVLK